MDYYYSIEEHKSFEDKIKGSRFIANVFPIESKEEADKYLATIRKEHYDATHNCYAYILGSQGLEYRANDDGEPNGSAGNPILFSIKKYKLSDVLVVVTRFYGGTKLGVGGLARAYGGTAEEVVKLCKRRKIDITKRVKIFTTYDDINTIKRLLDEYAVSFEEVYTDTIEIIAEIPLSKVIKFRAQITEQTADRSGSREE
ncbi:MAG: YigZ family protein [Candidatus Kapaibacterium sp.]